MIQGLGFPFSETKFPTRNFQPEFLHFPDYFWFFPHCFFIDNFRVGFRNLEFRLEPLRSL